jgi:hypothetical protein
LDHIEDAGSVHDEASGGQAGSQESFVLQQQSLPA